MKLKCPVCSSKNLKKIDSQSIICMSCENIVSGIKTYEQISTNITRIKKKQEFAKQIETIQKENTKKPYLRFQFRIV